VNDFRKIADLECYAPTDNVSELTARTNDEGWASVFVEWLKGSRLNGRDAVLVLSVGGGNLEKLAGEVEWPAARSAQQQIAVDLEAGAGEGNGLRASISS